MELRTLSKDGVIFLWVVSGWRIGGSSNTLSPKNKENGSPLKTFHFTFFFTFVANDLAGLKDGMLCEGTMIVVFLEIFLAVFSALFFTTKLPKPLM
jgi:hypothetical protein